MDPIISISRLEREANQAATRYTDINAACPYPFDTNAGRLFKEFFLLAREKSTKNAPLASGTGTSSY